MATVNLGQVRDKITSIDSQSVSGNTTTYVVKTECSPNGAGTFSVTNGTNGSNGANGKNGVLVQVTELSSGANLVTSINNVGVKNVISIIGRQQGQSNPTYRQCTWSGKLSDNPNNSPTISDVAVYDESGQSIDLSTYSFAIVYSTNPEVANESQDLVSYFDDEPYQSLEALLVQARSWLSGQRRMYIGFVGPARTWQQYFITIAAVVSPNETKYRFDGFKSGFATYVSGSDNPWTITYDADVMPHLYRHNLHITMDKGYGKMDVYSTIYNSSSEPITTSNFEVSDFQYAVANGYVAIKNGINDTAEVIPMMANHFVSTNPNNIKQLFIVGNPISNPSTTESRLLITSSLLLPTSNWPTIQDNVVTIF